MPVVVVDGATTPSAATAPDASTPPRKSSVAAKDHDMVPAASTVYASGSPGVPTPTVPSTFSLNAPWVTSETPSDVSCPHEACTVSGPDSPENALKWYGPANRAAGAGSPPPPDPPHDARVNTTADANT